MRFLSMVVLVGFVSAAFGGCLKTGEGPAPAPPVEDVLPALQFLADVVVDSTMGATEPSITVAPDGTIWIAGPTGFVTPATRGDPEPYTHDSGLWSSPDGGKTWAWNNPIPGYGRDVCPGGGDSDISISPDGAIYLVDLYLGNVVLDVSTDKGATFRCNPATSAVPGDDRQWVEVFQNKYVYIMFNQIPTGIIVLRADRSLPGDGLVFTQQVPVNDFSSGNFVVDQQKGTIYLAAGCSNIQVSTDEGRTFTSKSTTMSASNDFCVIDVDDKGNVYLIANPDGSSLEVAWSTDAGDTWVDPVVVEPYDGQYRFPWIAAGGDGVVNIAWYGKSKQKPAGGAGYYVYSGQAVGVTSMESSEVNFTVVNVTSKPVLTIDICQGLGCGPGRALGDFFEITIDREGRALIAYNDANNHSPPLLSFAKQTAGPPAILNVTAAPAT